MANFCPSCGKQISSEAKFCPDCGANIGAQSVPNQNPVYMPQTFFSNPISMQGFSDRVNDPEILAAVRKNRRAAGLWAFFIVPLPIIGIALYSLFSEEIEMTQALIYGGIISLVFLVFAIIGFVKERAKNSYEATVTDKKTRTRYRSNSDSNSYYTEYITVVRRSDNKTKKIVEREGSQTWAWNYLQVGDRFRYHPQFNFPYELYDKSKAPYIVCVSCSTHNPVSADRCSKCGIPLLK